MDKKRLIISHVKFIAFHRMPEWDLNSVKKFIKFILDGENIDYTDDDLEEFILQGDNQEMWKLISRYAKLYVQIYSTVDNELACMLQKLATICDDFISFSNDLHQIFSDNYKSNDEKITIKKGESITFHNGAGSNITPKELERLMKVTFPNDEEEKEYRIEFSANVPEELKEEVEQKIEEIFEEFANNQEKPKSR